ncbi:MAG: sialidase family protein [Dermabacter sp.]|nr:sialidase family protein [Dermabacter sp.]
MSSHDETSSPTPTTDSPSAPVAASSVSLRFRSSADGPLLVRESLDGSGSLDLAIREDHLVLTVSYEGESRVLDAEDADHLSDGMEHAVTVTVGPTGTRLYLDGYEVFSSTSVLPLPAPSASRQVLGAPGSPVVDGLEDAALELGGEAILAAVPAPEPFVEFAAAFLSPRDASRVGALPKGSLRARFRVRGEGQGGVIVQGASADGALTLAIIDGSIDYRVTDATGEAMHILAPGRWDDGNWHDVVVTSGYGATTLYVDGYQVGRAAGVCFFADAGAVDRVSVGQDCEGSRLFGEAHVAMIFSDVLSERHVKRMAGVAPLASTALFDTGFEGSRSYRIPSLLTTASGVVIAGADQRTSIANDSPNHINFVVRRSLDGGHTWGPLQTVISSVGSGAKGASVIDSLLVQDRDSGRIIALIDHFPGGVGQPNASAEIGTDEDGRPVLYDRDGARYTAQADGSILDADGDETAFTLGADGIVREGERDLGHADLYPLADGAPPLTSAPTSYLWMVTSDDDGTTWSDPVDLTPSLKLPWMRFFGTSPGTGIQVREGRYAGRIVMPIYYNREEGVTFSCAVVYTDDAGETWHLGESPNDGRALGGSILHSRTLTDDQASLHESTVVETGPDELLVLMRNQHVSGRVAVARSHDGGHSWGPVTFDEELTEIFSQPNAIEVELTGGEGRAIVFANASQMLPFRGCGVLRMSKDGGHTWPHNRVFNPRHYVYQSMTQLPDSSIGLLWEREWHGLFFTAVPLAWLEASQSTIS